MADKITTQKPNLGHAVDTKMPEIDMETKFESLSPSDKYYVQKLNRINRERWEKVRIYRRGARRVGLSLTGVAIGICILC